MNGLRIPARFNGPPGSANGGYTCGLVAGALGAASAEVSLRAPPPLQRELALERSADGVTLRDAETVIAEGRTAEAPTDATDPVTATLAAEAASGGYEHWTAAHPFPTCFVCGADHDSGLRIFPGPLEDGRFAASWTPDASLAGDDGAVRAECVWAALDCPTSAPVANFGEGPPIVLARLTASLHAPVVAGEPHALVSWELGRDGRKREAACVLFDAQGDIVARSRALWIELRAE